MSNRLDIQGPFWCWSGGLGGDEILYSILNLALLADPAQYGGGPPDGPDSFR